MMNEMMGLNRTLHRLVWFTMLVVVGTCGERVSFGQAAGATNVAPATAVQSAAGRVPIRCADADGKPVAEAEVHVFQYSEAKQQYVAAGPFLTDAQGYAAGPEILLRPGDTWDRWFYARIPGKLVGCARSTKFKNRASINEPGLIKMRPAVSLTGQVEMPLGMDPRQVRIRVQTMHVMTGKGPFAYASFNRSANFVGLDRSLPNYFETRPNQQGQFKIHGLPLRGRVYLLTSGPGLAEAQWRNANNELTMPAKLQVFKEGVVTGKILSPSGAPAVGVKVIARLTANRGTVSHLTSFTAATNSQGRYTIRGLPASEFTFGVTDPRKRWVFSPQPKQQVTAGATIQLDGRMEVGVVLSGRVTDPQGIPVANAAISAVRDPQLGLGLAHDQTDDNGRYQLRVPLGLVKLYFNALPDGFEYPRPQVVRQLQLEADRREQQQIDLTLQRKKPASKTK